MSDWWADKTALVTGAGHGIGRAVSARLAGLGVRVTLVDINHAAVSEAAAAIDGATAAVCDVSSREQVEATVAQLESTFGGPHLVVNCAYRNHQTRFLEIGDGDWEEILGVSLTGTLLVGQIAAKAMLRQGIAGRIVNFTSGAARIARPGFTVYGVAKAGITHLTRYMAIELAEHGIQVNAINPGLTASEWVSAYEADPANAAEHAYKMARIPLGRIGECDEAAAAAIFLLGPKAVGISGALLTADGGTASTGPQEP